MRDAAQEAAWALSVAEANRIPISVYGDGAGLLMPRTPGEAQALVDHVLGELLAYDSGHGTSYVATVRAFVRADGSWQHAAAAIHVHKQTLGYRLRKVEELTGRGFARTAHMAEWWFALQAFDLLTACRKALAGGLQDRNEQQRAEALACQLVQVSGGPAGCSGVAFLKCCQRLP
jgi:PucR family transcriptional regulator, purine catabolism regulatory protein